MQCFITRTGKFLPNAPVENEDIEKFMGRMWGESKIKQKILAANGIKQRYYAQDVRQRSTHDVYEMAVLAIEDCLNTDGPQDDASEQAIGRSAADTVSYLAAGSTNTPLIGPGFSSILHGRLSEGRIIRTPIEINSNSGICSSAAQAIVNGYRAVITGNHAGAVCVGAEHPSVRLRARSIHLRYDWRQMRADLKKSEWFMSVFLRFMLSDGAGAFLLQNEKPESGRAYEINWTYSQSFANEAPLCMKLESETLILSQNIATLAKHLGACARVFTENAMKHHHESLASYDCILPHISSYIFIRELKTVIREQLKGSDQKPEFWTNLKSVGNTGAASIFVIFDEYVKTHRPESGTRLLLFVPESGQFNFVLISVTVV